MHAKQTVKRRTASELPSSATRAASSSAWKTSSRWFARISSTRSGASITGNASGALVRPMLLLSANVPCERSFFFAIAAVRVKRNPCFAGELRAPKRSARAVQAVNCINLFDRLNCEGWKR